MQDAPTEPKEIPAAKARPPVPFAGFRLVFGLVNAALWFAIAFGITSGISFGVAASRNLGQVGSVVFVAVVAFFVFFFGLSGALSGFLTQAKRGLFALPPEAEWGERGQLDSVWIRGLVRGAIAALIAAAAAHFYFYHQGFPSRGGLCLLLGGIAALLGGATLPLMIAWKAILGAAVDGLLAAAAARWELQKPALPSSEPPL